MPGKSGSTGNSGKDADYEGRNSNSQGNGWFSE